VPSSPRHGGGRGGGRRGAHGGGSRRRCCVVEEVDAELMEADAVQLVTKMVAAQRGRRGGAIATNHHTLCLHGIEKKHGVAPLVLL
jgi:hypothetical protein